MSRPSAPVPVTTSGLQDTLRELPGHDFNVTPDTPTQIVFEVFERAPSLPGVLLLDNDKFVGMVSRQKCMEYLSRRLGSEIYLQRPILTLYNEIGLKVATLPATTRINDAVEMALARPFRQIYEPLVVMYEDGKVCLLDLHFMLMAQSQLLTTANQLVQQQVEIGRALSGTLDLSEVLNLILESVALIVPHDRAAVMLERDQELEFVAVRGFPSDMDTSTIRIKITSGDVYQQIFATQQPLAIVDVSARQDWQYIEMAPAARAWLGVPLTYSNQVIGMLSLTRLAADDYNEQELALAQTFASQAAIALQNARLYGEIKRFNQQLEQMVRERTEALQAAYEKLIRLDGAKSKFIGVVSHELRTPLTVMGGYSQMLTLDPVIQSNESRLQMVTGIGSGVERLRDIVNSMLDIAKIDNQELRLHLGPIQLARFLRQVGESFASTLKERHLTLTLDEGLATLPAIEGDAEGLKKVFHHLIINAIKYTPDGGAITLKGQYWPHGHASLKDPCLQLSVCDTGIGIDPEFLEVIFEKFYQTGEVALHSSGKTKFKGGGPGLGLAIVRGITEAHNGTVWADSGGYDVQKLLGSRFHILLPVKYKSDV